MAGPDRLAFAAVMQRGRAALAWEVLRRQTDYRTAYAELPGQPAAGIAADPAFVTRWGLHFR